MTLTDTGPDIRCSDLVRIFTAVGVEVQALQGLNLRSSVASSSRSSAHRARASRRC